jgi:hypothetical protein
MSALGTPVTVSLVIKAWMTDDDDDCGAVGGLRISKGKGSTGSTPAPVPHCSPKVPYDRGLRHYSTSRKVAGSRPDEVNVCFQFT